MQFLKTLFWVALAVILVLFASENWFAVTLNLWGGLQADVKVPILVIAAFLLGFLPTFFLYQARLWSLRRRYEPLGRPATAPVPAQSQAPVTKAVVDNGEQRVATDSKAWPAE
jgi:uncharacterized integral membrane protein